MARYYIHIENGVGFIKDEVGADYADDSVARERAVTAGADIIADELRAGCGAVRVTLFVEDAEHRNIMTIPMSADVGTGAPLS